MLARFPDWPRRRARPAWYHLVMSTTTTATKKPTFQPPPPSAEHLATQKVATRLVELCTAGKNLQALQELYADNAKHVEAMDSPDCPRITSGKATLIQKAEQWAKITTIHGATYAKPLINGDQFTCAMSLDCTSS